MYYFLIAMAVAFGSVFLTSVIGALLSRKNVGVTSGIGFVASILYGLLIWWVYWSAAIGVYGPAPFLGTIILGAIIGAVIAYLSEDSGVSIVPGVIIVVCYLFYVLVPVLWVGQSDMINSKEKAQLIGKVKTEKALDKVMEPADTAHVCRVSEDMARTAAQNALSKFKLKDGAIPGSRYTIGDPTKQFVDGQLWWIFPLEFKGWLKWRRAPQVPGYIRVSAENPFAEGQAVQLNKLGEEINVKYLNTACWEFKAERHLRYDGYMGKILKDWTYEPDDNWNPYYTVSVVERTMGYAGYKTKGVVTLNVQTGDHEFYPIDKLPSWIDRGIPLDVIDYNTVHWGEYEKEGWWYCLLHDDKSQKPTEGWFLTYDSKGGCQWYSGFTSKDDQDTALTGFITINARNGKAKFFPGKGYTEERAYETAKSMWSIHGEDYNPTDLVPYNIYGLLTYVVPMAYTTKVSATETRYQYKGVSLVALRKLEINGAGETLEESLRNYRASISRSGSGSLSPTGGDLKTVVLDGVTIFRVGKSMMQGKQQVFPFILEGVPKIFHAVYTFSTPEVPMMERGDSVSITYKETLEPVITCLTFDILGIELSNESPVQARYLENQEKVDKETGRIDKELKRQDLIEGDQLKNVDPDKLEKFLKEQEKK